jgi:hypothetical protein
MQISSRRHVHQHQTRRWYKRDIKLDGILPKHHSKKVPQKILIKLLEIIMRRNVFSFDDTSWIQEIGTAMGTPWAWYYATLSYTLHEVHIILAAFTKLLMILKFFIDDMFRIYIGGEGKEWTQFKQVLEGFGKLKWLCSDLSNIIILLELTLTITNNGHATPKQKLTSNQKTSTYTFH